jgi:hypothetical protein
MIGITFFAIGKRRVFMESFSGKGSFRAWFVSVETVIGQDNEGKHQPWCCDGKLTSWQNASWTWFSYKFG